MARNGSGTYSKVNTFVAGNTITAAGHNQNMDDLVAEMTNSVAADGQTTITGALKGANGTVSLPAYSFASDLDSGVYRIGANNIGVAVNGAKVLDVATTGLTVTGTLTAGIAGLDIIGATQLTAPANDDTLPIYDLSTTTNKRILLSDFFKVINDLTADGSPDSAADYVVTYDASATGSKKVLLSSLPSNLGRGYIDGLILSNGTDATNDINISAGKCRDSTDAVDIVIATALGKQLDANWAAGGTTGTPAGGRNSAAGITDASYHVWAVRTAASSAGDVYFHTSTTAATVLTALQAETGGASYVYARLIGSIVRASGAIILFTQTGNYVRFKTPTMDANTTTLTSASVSFALASIPTGISMPVRLNALCSHATAAIVYVRNPDDTDTAVTNNAAPLANISSPGSAVGIILDVICNTSAEVAARSNVASTTLRLAPIGFFHPRGTNA
jgi:hypothetical protein